MLGGRWKESCTKPGDKRHKPTKFGVARHEWFPGEVTEHEKNSDSESARGDFERKTKFGVPTHSDLEPNCYVASRDRNPPRNGDCVNSRKIS